MVERIWQGTVLEDEMYMRLKQETGKHQIQPIDYQHVLSKIKWAFEQNAGWMKPELRAIQLLNTERSQALPAE